MSYSKQGDAEFAEIIKTLDFSARSAKHKQELWRKLSASARKGGQLLSDDELDMAAGGKGVPPEPEKPDKP